MDRHIRETRLSMHLCKRWPWGVTWRTSTILLFVMSFSWKIIKKVFKCIHGCFKLIWRISVESITLTMIVSYNLATSTSIFPNLQDLIMIWQSSFLVCSSNMSNLIMMLNKLCHKVGIPHSFSQECHHTMLSLFHYLQPLFQWLQVKLCTRPSSNKGNTRPISSYQAC